MASDIYADSVAFAFSRAGHHREVTAMQRAPRTAELKKLDAAMHANAALYLLDTLAEMLGQIPHVDARLSRNIRKWHDQLIFERNRMLPLSDKADRLVHNDQHNRPASAGPG